MKKNKLKKSIALILSLGMALSLCTACSTDNDDLNETQTQVAKAAGKEKNKSTLATDNSGEVIFGGKYYAHHSEIKMEAKVISAKDDNTALVEVTYSDENADNRRFKKGDKIYLKTDEVSLERYNWNCTSTGITIEYPHKVKSGEIINFSVFDDTEHGKKDGMNYYNDINDAEIKVTDIKYYPEEDLGSQSFEDNGEIISIEKNGDLVMKFEKNGCGFFKEDEDTALVHYDRAIVYEYSSVKGKGKITDSDYTPKVGDTLQVYAEPKNTYSESDTAFAYRDGKPYVKATGSLVKYVEK